MLEGLLIIAAFGMELIGSLISIIGVSAIFGRDFLVIALIIALDFAKILSVSFLYQYWEVISKFAKWYLCTAVFILVVATSSGAFGYLSGKVQQASKPSAAVSISIDKLSNEQARLKLDRAGLVDAKLKIDLQIAQLPSDRVRGRQQLLASFKPELKTIEQGLAKIDQRQAILDDELAELANKHLSVQQEQGPLVQMAKSMGISVDSLSKWVILLIVSIFDPLAIAMVLSANFVIKHKRLKPKAEIINVPDPIIPAEEILEVIEAKIEKDIEAKIEEVIEEPVEVKLEEPPSEPEPIKPVVPAMPHVSFIQRCLVGSANVADLEQEVNNWWNAGRSITLDKYLGLTLYEYDLWFKDYTIFSLILQARRENKSIDDVLAAYAKIQPSMLENIKLGSLAALFSNAEPGIPKCIESYK